MRRELAVSGLRLIGDIGGTNARFAIAENGAYRQLKHVEVDRHPSLHDALSAYLKALPDAERADLSGALAIVGPGTGLGVSALIPTGGDWVLIAGEGGHATLAASNEEEEAIIHMLRKRWSHVSAERVLSGAGLVNLYEAVCAIDGVEPLMLSPADVTQRAMSKSDGACVRAFAHFC